MRSGTALVAGFVLAVAACAAEGHIDGPVLASPEPFPFTGSGMDALVSGMLVYEASTDCLYLANGDVRQPVIWPAGARWQSDPPAVRIDDVTVAPGDFVQGAGGYIDAALLSGSIGEALADAVATCQSGEVAVFNAGSEIRVER